MNQTTQQQEIEARSSAPLSQADQTLLVCFAKDVAEQATRLDDLAKRLITLEIAIPGMYAAALKLVSGGQATPGQPLLLLLALSAWLFALGMTLASLFPQRYAIDPDSLTEIQNYFSHSARRKLIFLSIACVSSFFGICLTVYSLLVSAGSFVVVG